MIRDPRNGIQDVVYIPNLVDDIFIPVAPAK